MKRNKRKWNRAHKFARKKSSSRKVGHPVYIYGTRGKYRKYLIFTHNPEEGKEENYEELLYNIDPNDKEKCFVRKQYGVSNENSFREPDGEYRIHEKDKERVKKYKK